MRRRPPRSTRTATLFPYTPLSRSGNATAGGTISTGTRLTAQAMGGSMSDTIRQSAGNGIGGDVDFLADGGTIRAEVYDVDVSGNTADVTGAGGTAQGGTSDVRSEERRVGNACVSTCRSRSSPYH